MAVKAKPATFQATDGKEFVNLAEAEAHDRLLNAVADFDYARDRLDAALCGKCKTADGEVFNLRACRDYYFLHDRSHSGPALEIVRFDYDTRVLMSDHIPQVAGLIIEHSEPKGVRKYRVGELFANPRKAQLTLAEAIKRHIVVKQQEIKSLSG